MTGFMKTVSILCNPMTHVHVHFTISKGLTIEGNKKKKNTKQREKEDKREERKKKTDIAFNFYIVEFGENKTLERNASSLTLFS